MAYFEYVAQLMVDTGFYDVVLPFMFVFTILFAVLQRTKVFGSWQGKPKTNVNAMFAFVVAFIFVASLARVNLLTTIVQKLAVVIVASICVLLITGLFSGREGSLLKYRWVMIVLFVIVIIIFGTSLGWVSFDDLGIVGEWLFHPITVLALAFILVLYFIIKEPKTGEPEKPAKEAKKKKEKPGERPRPPQPPLYEPQLEKKIPREELYGGEEGDVIWKG